mmetsp:Transcript_8898/g.18994  ORF Transcript_8898/g.18994 Transcript_8898/m.18994 type:complete len:220 (+) Transcript_8898:728-1387(+)
MVVGLLRRLDGSSPRHRQPRGRERTTVHSAGVSLTQAARLSRTCCLGTPLQKIGSTPLSQPTVPGSPRPAGPPNQLCFPPSSDRRQHFVCPVPRRPRRSTRATAGECRRRTQLQNRWCLVLLETLPVSPQARHHCCQVIRPRARVRSVRKRRRTILPVRLRRQRPPLRLRQSRTRQQPTRRRPRKPRPSRRTPHMWRRISRPASALPRQITTLPGSFEV